MWELTGYRSWLTALSRALWGPCSNSRGSLFLLLTSEAVLPTLVALTPENATRVLTVPGERAHHVGGRLYTTGVLLMKKNSEEGKRRRK